MASETAGENARVLELLELQPDDQVLEVGFGPGRTLARAAEMLPDGFVAGVDPSEEMVQVASSHNKKFTAGGTMELKLGSTSQIPYSDERFDKVYSVHTLYFWTEPVQDLQEIRRVMKVGGRLVLGFRAKDEKALADFPATIYRFYTPEEATALLRSSGFEQIQIVRGRFSSRDILFAVAYRAN
jgi:ubiquinone/menaquinone biosynthesis C-methylase UbiE